MVVFGLIPSKTTLKVFYFNSYFIDIGWDKKELNKDFEWKVKTLEISNNKSVIEEIENCVTNVLLLIKEELEAKFETQ